jgi:succinyl-CoA synthetase beta subunit
MAKSKCDLPIVVKMDGRFFEKGKQLLADAGLNIELVNSMDEGAKLIISKLN